MVEAAIARLDEEFGLFDSSPIILNAADGGAGRDFANAVALIESDLDPVEMLARLKQWKASSAGAAAGAGDRACSTSISPCGAAADTDRAGSTIPHPQLASRSFVFSRSRRSRRAGAIGGGLSIRHLAHRLARRAPRG